ncbi:beta-ketoacyl synthase domain-containing protein [Diaporthe helianthi]|uniref:6-methylsalicylic acid synthase n=1 Tax=Diaporthe helianthi TaxID=158607 RepID=A0A1I9KHX3_DIAHE|nr:polyketide synthase 3 [Diaporthe helianthi]POS71162.1 beta-ketoacyl synthase domain-containing protein [Diaporthe helianthi]
MGSVGTTHPEDVAIIGISCRAAGGNNSPDKLWEFLMNKQDASGEVPSKRWEPWYRRDARNAKVIDKAIRKGYFIEDLENFDAAFFGISSKEAEQMDPHQRLGLELTWEALENAGIDPKSLMGSDTAVYMGCDSDDFSRLMLEDIPNIEAWMGIGSTPHGIPNRISYHLDLMGPSAAVDAACASSGVAVHLGRQAIASGESTVAIVGGVNVLCSPALFVMLGKAGALSPDGVCLSFDDAACGYARGEGGAVLILKRLDNAIADNDNILAVLKGSAIAQDGKTKGIMAPNAKAQELVARQALARSHIDPLEVGFIEAHATSTSLGDPTEVSAIAAVYGRGRPAGAPALIGSIKPNVGHLEAAAGAISMVKAVMAVNKGELAPQARLTKLNSRIDWKSSGLQVIRERTKWTEPEGLPRRAAVCSYGYGGTVSHTVIEEYQSQALNGHDADSSSSSSSSESKEPPRAVTLVISAPQEKRLPNQATALADWLAGPGKDEDLKAIAATLALRRAPHTYRATFVVTSHEEAIDVLRSFADEKSTEGTATGRILDAYPSQGHAVWVFSGHGAQWAAMGKELLQYDQFSQAVSSLDHIVQEECGYSAVKALETGDIGESDRVQVLTYLVQIGLSLVLRSKGLQPRAVIGHSVGEIAASVVAGCLTAREGALIVTRRAKLYAQVKGLGGMALVSLPFATVAKELKGTREIVPAIDSSPNSCVVSGESAPLLKYLELLKARGVKTFKVNTDIAFHCPMLEKLSEPLKQALAKELDPQKPLIPLYSTSKPPRSDSPRDVAYWVDNMISPVWLTPAINAAADDGLRVFVEISSHPIVTHSINETLGQRDDVDEFVTIRTMKRDAPTEKSIQHAIASLWTRGSPVNFEAQFGRKVWSKTAPGTPWVHKRFWKEVESGPIGGSAVCHDVDKHTVLGQRTSIAGTEGTVVFTTKLNDQNKPYPLTHPLDGTEIIPAGVYCNTFHHATGATVLDEVKLRVPVPMSSETREVQIIVSGQNIRVASRLEQKSGGGGGGGGGDDQPELPWVEHSSARWSKPEKLPIEPTTTTYDIAAIKKRIGTVLPNGFAWEYLQKIGVSGIAFPWQVVEHYGNEKEMIARVDMDPDSDSISWDPYSWGPLLDAATSVGSTIFFKEARMRIVSQIDRVMMLSSDPRPKVAYLYIEEASDPISPAAHVTVLTEQGDVIAKFQAMRFSDVEGATGISGSVESLVYQLAWIPPKLSEKSISLNKIVLVCEDQAILQQYAGQIQGKYAEIIKVASSKDMNKPKVLSALSSKESAVLYLPGKVKDLDDVAEATHRFVWEAVSVIKVLVKSSAAAKAYVVTDQVYMGQSPTALAHGALYGLARIAAEELPDNWGALIDNEGGIFPTLALKYVRGEPVIRMNDGVPRIGRLRPLSRDQRHGKDSTKTLLPKPEGTYIVTGGLGGLGREVLEFLVEKKARRIVVISRSGLPPRREWDSAGLPENTRLAIAKVRKLEQAGAWIHAMALDIGARDAHERLLAELDRLSLPPVLGVVHAAGILDNDFIQNATAQSYANVFAPKVSGSLALHRAFPPGTLDFFVLFSSTGQLVGMAGQSSYGSANSFLDALATHRRARGDNAVALQYTVWRGLGLATATDAAALESELVSKGVTDITAEEGFRAWEHIGKYDLDHGVVTRVRTYDHGERVPLPLIEEVVPRRFTSVGNGADGKQQQQQQNSNKKGAPAAASRPTSGPELKDWLNVAIRGCLAAVMMGEPDEIDPRAAVADLGVDSVMTVVLSQKLQAAMGIKVPVTLTWNHPTVLHMVEWFYVKLTENV